jgi:hypothetical protein
MEKIEKKENKVAGGKIRTVTSLERTRAPKKGPDETRTQHF